MLWGKEFCFGKLIDFCVDRVWYFWWDCFQDDKITWKWVLLLINLLCENYSHEIFAIISLWNRPVVSLKLFHIMKKKKKTVKLLVSQLCPNLYDSMDCSPPGSSVHGILQARILEWVAMPSSRGSSWPRHWTGSPVLRAESLWPEPPRRHVGKEHDRHSKELLWYLSLCSTITFSHFPLLCGPHHIFGQILLLLSVQFKN